MSTVTSRAKHFALVIALVMFMATVMASFNASHAALSSAPAPTQVNSVISSDYFKGEYYKVTTPLDEDNVIYVEGKTKIKTKRFCIRLTKHKGNPYITVFVVPDANGEFSIKINTAKGNTDIPEVIDGKGTVATAEETYGNQPGYKAVENIPAGTYHLTIARATTTADANISQGTEWWEGALGGDGGKAYAYKEAVLTVKSGDNNNPKIVQYNAAIKNNNSVRNAYEKKSYNDPSYKGSYVRYTNTYMSDMIFVFDNPKTGKRESMTAEKVAYIKKVSKSVTSGASTNYDKLLKIYEYVGKNFYYDNLAFKKGKYQYANPYNNIYNFRNKKTTANSYKGKVATTCQGYAAMVVALARAEGIPARLVYGHHLSQPIDIWATEKSVSKTDHWWAEAWVNGRWVIIDANSATKNEWERSSFSAKGTWSHGGNINYAHFDPSAAQFSNSFSYNGVHPGNTAGKYINRTAEIKQLRTFLNTKSSGKTNGKRLNKKYSSANFATWNTGKASSFKTDGYGRVTHILWGNKKMVGSMNLSNFSKLKYLTVYNNKLSKLTLTGCSSLVSISASYNNLTSFDSTASKKTTTINLKGNKLTKAKYKHGSKTITIATNNKGGSFGFKYNKSNSKKLTIYANSAKKGYKYLGIYSSSGKKLTSKKTYTCKGTSSKYVVKYKKK